MQTVEEPSPERFLKKFDLPTYRGLGHPELIGCQSETAVTCDRLEFDESGHRGDEPPVPLSPRSCRFHLTPRLSSLQAPTLRLLPDRALRLGALDRRTNRMQSSP